MLDLKTLTRPRTRNHHLVAPAGFGAARADAESPRFALAGSELYALVRSTVLGQPRTSLREEAPERLSLEVRQRTPLFRFPDDVTITVLPTEGGGSTLAIYSRSLCGRGDLGTNRRRVERWLEAIEAAGTANQR